MGFGTVFATFVFVLIILFSINLVHMGEMTRADILSNAERNIHELRIEQINTDIKINISNVNTLTNNTLIIANLTNTGSTKILHSDFRYMDVFVRYTTDITTTTFNRPSYTTGTTGGNEWEVLSIFPDTRNPRTFDPDERMEIRINLTPPMMLGSTGWLKVVTPNGISDSTHFIV